MTTNSNKFITVGNKAYSFHDPNTGITVVKGEVKEITPKQYNTRRIRLALNTGHLVLVAREETVSNINSTDVEKLVKKFESQKKQAMTIEKMAKSYTLSEAKVLAKEYEVETDDTDTVQTILEALLEDDDK